jgi:hypothetical protein
MEDPPRSVPGQPPFWFTRFTEHANAISAQSKWGHETTVYEKKVPPHRKVDKIHELFSIFVFRDYPRVVFLPDVLVRMERGAGAHHARGHHYAKLFHYLKRVGVNEY